MVASLSLIKRCVRRWQRDETAFTLIELLVVCLLLSLTLAVSVPALRDTLLTDQLKATSRKIIGAVRERREEAVRDQQSFVLYVDMDKNHIWYEKDGEKDPEERKASFDRGMQLPASVRILDVWTKSDGRKVGGIASLWITRQGYMDQTVIHMTDGSDTQSILFSPFLGSIKVVDGYAEVE
jgi:type II secretory pathway pseudopilin PulG